MDYLGNNKPQREVSKSKRLVLTLLVISIALLILGIVAIYAFKGNKTNPLTLSINNTNTQITENMLITKEDGTTYISLKSLSSLIGYDYIEGDYLDTEVDSKKCYLESSNQIIGFEENSKKIYKTEPNSIMDYEYYDLAANTIKSNDSIYVRLDDLNIACNVVYTYSKAENRIYIDTIDFSAEKYEKDLKEKTDYASVSNIYNNEKALYYGMIVVKDKNGKMGIIDSSYKTIINAKYTDMLFSEYTQNYIVGIDGKYGIINKEGRVIVESAYDEISIINYEPLLYKVRYNNKYGLLNEDGQIIINIYYDKIGYDQRSPTTKPALIVDNINNKTGLVVANGDKYGIIDLNTGEEIIGFLVDRIYTKTERNKNKTYYVEYEGIEYNLNTFYRTINTTIINL